MAMCQYVRDGARVCVCEVVDWMNSMLHDIALLTLAAWPTAQPMSVHGDANGLSNYYHQLYSSMNMTDKLKSVEKAKENCPQTQSCIRLHANRYTQIQI